MEINYIKLGVTLLLTITLSTLAVHGIETYITEYKASKIKEEKIIKDKESCSFWTKKHSEIQSEYRLKMKTFTCRNSDKNLQ
ncbi:MAG: hypothetical protein HRT50_17930 [Colwellia sp.]|uniref:hypothetical protein n=1 Tax=Colwellia sp. TaxID=56799 RepID=UPI001DC6E113|nr:hypothetical protein [Colwellia sp.]NQY50938.1 hypothetical protein [Colwellia sp.]